MSDLFIDLKNRVQSANPVIVFPEGTDERILEAASRLASEKVLQPILVGNPADVTAKAQAGNFSLDGVQVLNPAEYGEFDALVDALVERRKGKTTEEQARKILLDENYFGTMLVYTGKAHGLVSGAAHSTADTVRPALQIIKTKEGVKKTSGAFIMVRGDEKYVFADCAINISPSSQDLAESAMVSAETARVFGIDPKVALLSFSTKGSAVSPETEKVVEALEVLKGMNPDFPYDGELQFDAAFVPSVAAKKHQNHQSKGKRTYLFSQALKQETSDTRWFSA